MVKNGKKSKFILEICWMLSLIYDFLYGLEGKMDFYVRLFKVLL